MVKEVWKTVEGYDYVVSNRGRIKNNKGELIQPTSCRKRGGYLQVGLSKSGKRRWFRVHRLVWEAFYGPVPDGYEINHKDTNPRNNRLENLNLLTRSENIRWAGGAEKRGKSHRKKVMQSTVDGQELCVWFSLKGIEEELGYKRGCISNCCRKVPHYKTAYGYVWNFV